jgi:GNAT superfamily N-acetyltransferase
VAIRFDVSSVADLSVRSTRQHRGLDEAPDWFVAMVASNPAARGDDPALCVLGQDDTAIARLRLFPTLCRIGGQSVRCHWGMDFLSAPEFRSRGAGLFLIRHVLELLAARGEFYAAYASSEEAVRVYRMLGLVHVGRAPRYLWPRRTRPVLEAHLSRTVARAAAPVLDAALGFAAGALGLRRRRAMKRWLFEPRTRFDPEVDTIEPANGSGALADDAAMLNWKLDTARTNPRRRLDVDYVRERTTGKLAGYLLTRTINVGQVEGHPYQNFRILSVVDFRMAPGGADIAHALIRRARTKAREHAAEIIEVVGTDARMLAALQSAQFRRAGGHDFAYKPPPGYRGACPATPDEWRLTMAAGDGFLL